MHVSEQDSVGLLIREAGFNRVNLENGYSAVRIISPLEIVYESEDEEV